MTNTVDSGQVDISGQIKNLSSLYPTYALRAWVTALLAQTHQACAEAQTSIDSHESEIKRLREQLNRSVAIVKSLEDAIPRIDGFLRQRRDVEINREFDAQHERLRQAETSPNPGTQSVVEVHHDEEPPPPVSEAVNAAAKTAEHLREAEHEEQPKRSLKKSK